MASNSILLAKLNRFILFTESPLPSPSPSPPTNNDDDNHNLLTTILEWLSTIPNFFLSLLPKINLDPETRSRWIAAATPWLIAAAILLCLCCCLPIIINLLALVAVTCLRIITCIVVGIFNTCRWVVMGIWSTCKVVCCCCGRSTVKMMKAPGTGGLIMARSVFEAAPKVYFASLRAGAPLLR